MYGECWSVFDMRKLGLEMTFNTSLIVEKLHITYKIVHAKDSCAIPASTSKDSQSLVFGPTGDVNQGYVISGRSNELKVSDCGPEGQKRNETLVIIVLNDLRLYVLMPVHQIHVECL